ncbi:zinc finger CCCH domain-containing protein 2-like [Curcuma longa]|uniref:zinc finger CCCH domain-containing protein 2-like n=1 Tax=Curcuma longa TaxID=136217 RepID=UPI003D9EE5C9
MMVGGETGRHRDPLARVPPWSSHLEDPIGYCRAACGGGVYSLGDSAALAAAMQRYLPYNGDLVEEEEEGEVEDEPYRDVDLYSSDEFRMYDFKVRRCTRRRSHDWTECPFAHPGEKARRRDPRTYHYSGTSCPDFRKGGCKRGDACEFAHGVFECWLHPARYRTQPCKDGTDCRRRVCFFAHTADQLRVLSQQQQMTPTKPVSAGIESYDGSPLRQHAVENYISNQRLSSSPTSTLLSDSPPASPSTAAFLRASWPPGPGTSISDVVASLRQLQISKANSLPSSWGLQTGNAFFGSPRGKSGFSSLPTTPTTSTGEMGWLEAADATYSNLEEPAERVESGRALRAKIFEKLSKECVVDRSGAPPAAAATTPNVDWVSELVK